MANDTRCIRQKFKITIPMVMIGRTMGTIEPQIMMVSAIPEAVKL